MIGAYRTIVADVLSKAVGRPPVSYDAVVWANGLAAKVIKVHAFTEVNNYVEDCFQTFHMTCVMVASEARYLLSHSHGAINVKLIRYVNGRPDLPINLTGIANIKSDDNITSGAQNTEIIDDVSVAVVTFELYSPAAWRLRPMAFGVTYKEMTPLDAVRDILASNRLDDQLSDKECVRTIDYAISPQKHYYVMTIPDGTPLLGVFDYIQNHYGIYPKGLGVFLYKQSWHLFQPWDKQNFGLDQEKLTIYNIPEGKMTLPDKSYYFEGKNINVVATGKTAHLDDTDVTAMNQGTGYRVGAIRALELRTNDLSDGVAETVSNEFVTSSEPNPHSSGIVNAPIITDRYKDDDKSISSQFFRNGGTIVKVRWENSITGALRPGMPTKFVYAVGSKIVTRLGTLIGEVSHESLPDGSIATPHHEGVTELTVWLAN